MSETEQTDTQRLLARMGQLSKEYHNLLNEASGMQHSAIVGGAQPIIARLAAGELGLEHLLGGQSANPTVGEGKFTGR